LSILPLPPRLLERVRIGIGKKQPPLGNRGFALPMRDIFCRGGLYACPLMPRCWQGNRKGLPLQNTDIVTYIIIQSNRINVDDSLAINLIPKR